MCSGHGKLRKVNMSIDKSWNDQARMGDDLGVLVALSKSLVAIEGDDTATGYGERRVCAAFRSPIGRVQKRASV